MKTAGVVGLLGVAAILGGILSGGPDIVGGVAFGIVALTAAAVIATRRSAVRDPRP